MKLKTCPFCGCESVYLITTPAHNAMKEFTAWLVQCRDCLGSGGVATKTKLAVINWNRRFEDGPNQKA